MNNRKGLSLIEVTVALAILVLIMGGMLDLFSRGLILSNKSKDKAIAYSLAKEKLEENFIWPPVSEAQAPVNGFSGFERRVVVTSPYLGNADLARIQVTVWWNSGNKSQSFETMKADY